MKISSTPVAIFEIHPQGPLFRVHGSFPQLARIHFAQTFIPLDLQPLFAFFQDGLHQFSRPVLEDLGLFDLDLVRRFPNPMAEGPVLQFTEVG